MIRTCLDGGRNDASLCDAVYYKVESELHDPLPSICSSSSSGGGSSRKTLIFWSGCSAEAEVFGSHLRSGGGPLAPGYVMADTYYAKLLEAHPMADFSPGKEGALVPGCGSTAPGDGSGGRVSCCDPLEGWPRAHTIVAWERASVHFAASACPEDDIAMLVKKHKSGSVFMMEELPVLITRRNSNSPPISVRIHEAYQSSFRVGRKDGKAARARVVSPASGRATSEGPCTEVKRDIKMVVMARHRHLLQAPVKFACETQLKDDFITSGTTTPQLKSWQLLPLPQSQSQTLL
jgi:hypothetical protein